MKRSTEKEKNLVPVDAMIQAARELIIEKGFERMSMRDVVNRAGSSVGNAYFHFGNKQGLLESVRKAISGERWAVADQMLSEVSDGTDRFGLALYLHILPGLSGALPEISLHEGSSDYVVIDALGKGVAGRFLTWLPNELPEIEESRLVTLVQAMIGVAKNIIHSRLRGDLNGDPHDVAMQLVRWNLGGFGVSEKKIISAQQLIDSFRKDGRWPWEIFDGGIRSEESVRGVVK